MRNLPQYKNLSDEEYDEIWEKRITGVETDSLFEQRIQRKIDEFGEDYDLDDLKANDKLTLRGLAQAYITLEDLENYTYKVRFGGIEDGDIVKLEKINAMMSALRRDISSMQNDLKITRRVRKGDKEESVINYIEDLKQKAKKFYKEKMSYILCPKCNLLLATVWTMYPEGKNKITLTCNRKLQDGSRCGHTFTITTADLLEKKGANLPELLPETLL